MKSPIALSISSPVTWLSPPSSNCSRSIVAPLRFAGSGGSARHLKIPTAPQDSAPSSPANHGPLANRFAVERASVSNPANNEGSAMKADWLGGTLMASAVLAAIVFQVADVRYGWAPMLAIVAFIVGALVISSD